MQDHKWDVNAVPGVTVSKPVNRQVEVVSSNWMKTKKADMEVEALLVA